MGQGVWRNVTGRGAGWSSGSHGVGQSTSDFVTGWLQKLIYCGIGHYTIIVENNVIVELLKIVQASEDNIKRITKMEIHHPVPLTLSYLVLNMRFSNKQSNLYKLPWALVRVEF
jgi:hypothetical protein